MTVVRMSRTAATFILLLAWTACGDYYRPVANPLIPSLPNPSSLHLVVVISGNGSNNPGTSTSIDVSGDSALSRSTVGLMPAHAGLGAGNTRVYVANTLDDTVSGFSPAGAVPVSTISMPSGSGPSFVNTTEIATVYVANTGNGTVSAISTVSNVITGTIPVGISPVAMAELPNGQKLYVANRGHNGSGGSVTSINTIDLSVNPPIAGSAWVSPVWVSARSDSQRVYVLDTGSGQVSAIDPATDAVVGSAAVGPGADFMFYDSKRNRLYVTNPATNQLISLEASSDALLASTVPVAGAISVTALADGTRVYVAGASLNGGSVTSRVTVVSAAGLSVKTTIPLTTVPVACATTTWSELSIAAAADSSRVYVGNCDAGNTAIIQTLGDRLLTAMPAPLSARPAATPGGIPPPQNPVFVLAGP